MKSTLKFKPKTLKKIVGQFCFLVFVILLVGCNSTPENEQSKDSESDKDIVLSDVVKTIRVFEHQLNEVPLTSAAKKGDIKPESSPTPSHSEGEFRQEEKPVSKEEPIGKVDEPYEIVTLEELQIDLLELDYEPPQPIAVAEAIIPLDDTESVVSFNQKGKEKGALQVSHDPVSGEVTQVVFSDKKHTDVYDVSHGLSGKEVKKLRKQIKHMVKKGQVFLYEEDSNIMYLMNVQDVQGDEITAVDVENMSVQAIVWKDKKHHSRAQKK